MQQASSTVERHWCDTLWDICRLGGFFLLFSFFAVFAVSWNLISVVFLVVLVFIYRLDKGIHFAWVSRILECICCLFFTFMLNPEYRRTQKKTSETGRVRWGNIINYRLNYPQNALRFRQFYCWYKNHIYDTIWIRWCSLGISNPQSLWIAVSPGKSSLSCVYTFMMPMTLGAKLTGYLYYHNN